MASAIACGRDPAERSSSGVARSNGAVSLPRYRSLRSGTDIREVYQNGLRRRVAGLTVWTADGVPGPPRVAVVAGRAVGTAVTRNRAKRRLREALGRVELQDGRDYVVTAGPAVATAPFPDIVGWLETAVEDGENRRG